jgi:hypothetical protein
MRWIKSRRLRLALAQLGFAGLLVFSIQALGLSSAQTAQPQRSNNFQQWAQQQAAQLGAVGLNAVDWSTNFCGHSESPTTEESHHTSCILCSIAGLPPGQPTSSLQTVFALTAASAPPPIGFNPHDDSPANPATGPPSALCA